MTTKKQGGSLVGHFFHEMIDNKIARQGMVIENPEPQWYLIQILIFKPSFNEYQEPYFEWMMGNPTHRRLVRIEDMQNWYFYEDSDMMKSAYREYSRQENEK